MGIFKKIFGKPAAKAMNGDARVISAMLQSVKAGADCKTQVEAIKTMLGDSADETLKGYFEDLTGDEVAKADKETLGKAIDVVDTYCQKLFGDEVEEPKEAEKKKDEEAGDADVCPHCGKSPCECKSGDTEAKEPKKEASNGDSIDYEKLATMVAEKLKPAEKKAEAGDEAKTEVAGDEMEVSKLSALLAGDENSENAVTSDSVMKEIWG